MQVNSLCIKFLKKGRKLLLHNCIQNAILRSIKTAPHLALLVRLFFYPFFKSAKKLKSFTVFAMLF